MPGPIGAWSLLGLFLVTGLADDVRPPWQRMLKGEHAKKAARLEAQIAAAYEGDRPAEVEKLTRELLQLRIEHQGKDHWEVRSLQQSQLMAQAVARLTPRERELWNEGAVEKQRAQELHQRGDYWAGQTGFEKALAITRRVLGEDHLAVAASYNDLAINLKARGKHDEASATAEKALAITRRVLGEDHPDTAHTHNTLAGLLDDRKQHVRALPHREKALAIYRRTLGEQHPATASSYHLLGFNLMVQGKHSEARLYLQTALSIRLGLPGVTQQELALNYDSLAMNLAELGNHAEALDLAEQSLRIHRQTLGESHPSVARSCDILSRSLSAQGKYAEAGELLDRALKINQSALGEDHPSTGAVHNNLGRNLASRRRFPEAQLHFERALSIARSSAEQDQSFVATLHNNLGYVLDMQGKHGLAENLYRKALQIEREGPGKDSASVGTTLNNLAGCLNRQGKHADAEPLFRQALEIFLRTQGELQSDTVLNRINLAYNLVTQNKLREALPALEQTARTYEATRLLLGQQAFDRAVFSAQHSPYPVLACLHARLGHSLAAWSALETDLARGILDEFTHRRAKPLTARQQQQRGHLRKELAAREAAIHEHLSRAGDPAGRKKLEELLKQRSLLENQLTALAAEVSQGAVATLEQVQTALPADAALLTWVNTNDPSGGIQEHWACVVRREGLPLWEKLPGQGPGDKWTEADDALPNNLRALLPLAGNASQVVRLSQALARQRLAPVEKHLVGIRRLFVVSDADLAGVPVEILSDRYTITYIPSGTWLASRKDALPAAANGLLALGDPLFSPPRPASTVTDLPPAGLLILEVVPGGNAARARLQAGDVLVSYAGETLTSFAQLPPLIEKHAGAKSVEVKVWREKQKIATREVAGGKLGVAFEDGPAVVTLTARLQNDRLLASLRGGVWRELPGTRVELRSLGRLFGEEATVISGSRASRAQLDRLRASGRLAEYRHLHFATHGEANDLRAFESALILAREERPAGQGFAEGRLPAREVLEQWRLRADLVTLSACETALGSRGGGDGLLGFSQAFLLAGARSVCLSLWKVDDTATALLMERFYENLLGKRPGLAKPLSKAEALAEAKRWLRELPLDEAVERTARLHQGVARGKGEKALLVVPTGPTAQPGKEVRPFAEPRYWAAFILVGDAD